MNNQLLLGLSVEPTVAMKQGRQLIWQCADCGLVAVQSSLAAGAIAGCPACSCTSWRRQDLPVAGLVA